VTRSKRNCCSTLFGKAKCKLFVGTEKDWIPHLKAIEKLEIGEGWNELVSDHRFETLCELRAQGKIKKKRRSKKPTK